MATITVWNGRQVRQVRTFRSTGNLHLIRENGQYDVVRQFSDGRIAYLTSHKDWRRTDYDVCFDRHAVPTPVAKAGE